MISVSKRHGLLLIALAGLAWSPTLRLNFLIDDPFLVQGDPTIQRWSVSQIYTDFGPSRSADSNPEYYRPVQKLLTRAEFSCFGFHAAGYHWVHLILQACNAVLTAELAISLGFPMAAGVLAGMLFAVHPIIVHDMLQATGQEPFSYFLMMVSLLLFLWPGEGMRWSGFGVYLLALFSKESAVVIPFIYGLAMLLRPDLRLRRAIPALLTLIPYWFLRSIHMGASAVLSLGWTIRFLIQAFPKILFHYVAVFFLPWNLQSWPPVARLSHYWPLYLAGWLLLGWGMWKAIGRRGLFCYGWVLLMALPRAPAVMKNSVMMDHWIYASSLGLLLPPVLLGLRAWKSDRLWARKAVQVLLVLAIAAGAGLSHYYVRVRGTDESNYRWTLRFGSPDFALYRLGIILFRTGRPQEAVYYLKRLCEQSPGQPDYENALALACAHAGNRDQAVSLLQGILRRTPGYGPARINLELINKNMLVKASHS